MKKLKFSLLALSAVASSALTLTAAPASKPIIQGFVYPLDVAFTNSPPELVCIQALPLSATNFSLFSGDNGVVATESSGKIDGVMDITMQLGGGIGGTNGTNGHFVASISGTVGSVAKKNAPLLTTVAMTMKGPGFADGGGFQAPGMLNLTFKGQSDITTNGQSGIVTTSPGWNIWRNSDGTTNEMDRYDPWFNTNGTLQSTVTYNAEVDSFAMDTITTTNISGTNTVLAVTNSIRERITKSDELDGTFNITNSPYYPFNVSYGDQIAFGTPLILSSYYTTEYGTNPAGYISITGYGSNIVISCWAVGETSVYTTNHTATTVTNAGSIVAYSTNNVLYVGATLYTYPTNNLPPNTMVIDSTNNVFWPTPVLTVADTNTYLVLTPSSVVGGGYTTNLYYTPSTFSFFDNDSAHFGVEFGNTVTAQVYTNGSEADYDYFNYLLNQSLLFSTNVAALNSGSGTTTQNVYTNAWQLYALSFTNIDAASAPANSYYISNFFAGFTVYSNYVATSSLIINSNFTTITVTNFPVYGASFADFPAAWGAFASTLTNWTMVSGRSGSRYDSKYTGGYLWAVQSEDYFAQSIVAGAIPTTNAPTYAVSQEATRTTTNIWKAVSGTLNGGVTAGKLKVNLKNAPGIFEESHLLYTQIPGTGSEASYYIDTIPGNLNVSTNDMLRAEVKQIGSKFWTSGSDWDAFNGAGTITSSKTKGNSYKATLNGVARELGAKLSLAGTNGPLITAYSQVTNAPAVIFTVTNLASPYPDYLSINDTISGVLDVPTISQTNLVIVGNTTTLFAYNYDEFLVTNSYFQPTVVTNAINSVLLSGKLKGQTIPGAFGLNLNAALPNPNDYVTYIYATNTPAVSIIYTNYYGWVVGSPFGPNPNGP